MPLAVHTTFDIADPQLIAAEHPERSVLFARMSRRGPGRWSGTLETSALSLSDGVSRPKQLGRFPGRCTVLIDAPIGGPHICHAEAVDQGAKGRHQWAVFGRLR